MEATRWSGADWASENKEIMLVGAGGIGSWLALCLSRIGHDLIIFDGDTVDETNVYGGQMFLASDVRRYKVMAVKSLCRMFGATSSIVEITENFLPHAETIPIVISAVDNMAARKALFEAWCRNIKEGQQAVFIDGRLLMETMEIFCIDRNNKEQCERYKKDHLFGDEEVAALDCTTKQTTFSAMVIAGLITATLCNYLTNSKLGMEARDVPFYQRLHLPALHYNQININENAKEALQL